ncbi:MAG: hypothetical protein KJN61_08205 [Gammaproteobacteria bacterium]|nr:hypothetical protein [Gammaproteobacteria bacterium]
MNQRDRHTEPPDQTLAARFAQLRRTEAAEVPAVLSAQELAARAAVRKRHFFGAAPSLALAASVVFATVVFFNIPSQQPDTVDLYVDIMAGASFTTDALLNLSYGMSPEIASFPGVFELQAGDAESVQ